MALNATSDLEGLLTTQGVVAALVLGLVISLQGSIPQEEYDAAEFRYLLAVQPDFRAFAKTIWQQEGRNFSAQVDTDSFYDTLRVLNDGNQAGTIMGGGSEEWEMGLEITFNHMKGTFPLEKMRSFLAVHYDMASPSSAIIESYAVAFALLSISLLTSVTMYVSLLLSPINEDAVLVDQSKGEVPASQKSWARFGMPCIMVNNLFLIAGAGSFVFSTMAVTWLRSPRAGSMWFAFLMQMVLNIPGVTILGLVAPLVAFVAANRASYMQRGRETPVVPAHP